VCEIHREQVKSESALRGLTLSQTGRSNKRAAASALKGCVAGIVKRLTGEIRLNQFALIKRLLLPSFFYLLTFIPPAGYHAPSLIFKR